ncbi:MAG: DUF1572 family protein [Flavobacteriales bacterium]|nr:DUF1572 family protein [Flavobacteriales bacterium]
MSNLSANYLDNTRKIFAYYKSLGEKAFEQVSPNRINWYFHNDSNSIAIIVKHMSGNLKSRFTDFLSSDGEKTWRHRDEEFVDDIIDAEQMRAVWESGWKVLFDTLDSLTPADMDKTVIIRGEEHTVVEALNRQLTHHAYHVGQIVFLSKMLATDWHSLSIPKGGSAAFNSSMEEKAKA